MEIFVTCFAVLDQILFFSLGSQPAASELGSEADGVPSDVTESYENADDMSPDLQLKVLLSRYMFHFVLKYIGIQFSAKTTRC